MPPPASKKKKSISSAPTASSQTRSHLLDRLDNETSSKDRLEACTALATLFEPNQDDDADKLRAKRRDIVKLARDGLFKSLLRCSADKSEPIVRAHALGALRNVILTGKDKALTALQQEDAWTSLCKTMTDGGNGKFDAHVKTEALKVMEELCAWSAAVAEKRLPQSLDLVLACLVYKDRDVCESAVRLLRTASEGNAVLADTMVKTDVGKQVGQVLEMLVADPRAEHDSRIVASSLACGVLANIALTCQTPTLPSMVHSWILRWSLLISDSAMPSVTINDDVVRDARRVDAEEMNEDGTQATETEAMKRWLDMVEAQGLMLEIFGEIARAACDDEVPTAAFKVVLLQIVQVYEMNNLLMAALTFACSPWSGEIDGPISLTLPVAQLQVRATECAVAIVDATTLVPPTPTWSLLLQNSWSRTCSTLVQASCSWLKRLETDDRLTAFARLVEAIARNPNSQIALGRPEAANALMETCKTCRVREARGLLSGVFAHLARSNTSVMLEPVGTALIRLAGEEESIVVASEHVDNLIELFSDDDAVLIFRRIGGKAAFTTFASNFEKRFQEEARLDEDFEKNEGEHVREVYENTKAFVKWLGN